MSLLNSTSRPPDPALPAPATAPEATGQFAVPTPGQAFADHAAPLRAASPSAVVGQVGYPMTGRTSSACPDLPQGPCPLQNPRLPEGGGSPFGGTAGPCVIAVVTVEPASQGRDVVRLPLIIAAVVTAPDP
jgi:hypothetical protein